MSPKNFSRNNLPTGSVESKNFQHGAWVVGMAATAFIRDQQILRTNAHNIWKRQVSLLALFSQALSAEQHLLLLGLVSLWLDSQPRPSDENYSRRSQPAHYRAKFKHLV
jgi:hypothetical protein